MAPTTINLEVTNDHSVPVEPSLGGSVTVLNVSGDTLYYADNSQVSASNNQGSLTAGQSATFAPPQWLRSAGLSTVTVTVNDPSTSSSGASVSSRVQAVSTINRALSGALPTIDGYAVQDGDRVLLAGQTTLSQNGPWVAHVAGWVRPAEYLTAASITGGFYAIVTQGTLYAGSLWACATASVTVDTTGTSWIPQRLASRQTVIYANDPSLPGGGMSTSLADNSAAVNGINSLIGIPAKSGITVIMEPGNYQFTAASVVVGAARWTCALGGAGVTWTFASQSGNPTAFGIAQYATTPGQTSLGILFCDATGVQATGISFPSATAQNPQWAVMPGFSAFQYTGIDTGRTDTATVTNASNTVADTSVVAADRGRPVTGTGIPASTYVGTVTAGVSFLLSSSPTSQASVNANANGASVTIGNANNVILTGITDGHGNPGIPASAGGGNSVIAGPAVMGWSRPPGNDNWGDPLLDHTISVRGPVNGSITTLRNNATPTTTISSAVALSSASIPITNATTVAAGSNGVDVTTFAGAGSLSVASTTGYSTSGVVYVATSSGYATVNYTGTSGGNTFTGCTWVGGNTGTLSTGGSVSNFVPAGLAWVPSLPAGGMGTVIAYTGISGGSLTGCSIVTGAGGTATSGVTSINCITPPMYTDGVFCPTGGAMGANVSHFRHGNVYAGDHERFWPASHDTNYSHYFYLSSRFNPSYFDGGTQVWDPNSTCSNALWTVHYVMPGVAIQSGGFGMCHYINQPWCFWHEPGQASLGSTFQGMMSGVVDNPSFEQMSLGFVGACDSQGGINGTWIEGNATWTGTPPAGFTTGFGAFACEIGDLTLVRGATFLKSVGSTVPWFRCDSAIVHIDDNNLLGNNQSSPATNWAASVPWAPRTSTAGRAVSITFPGGIIAGVSGSVTAGDLLSLGASNNNVRLFQTYVPGKSAPAGVALQAIASNSVGAIQTSQPTLLPFQVNNKSGSPFNFYTVIYADGTNTGGVTATPPPAAPVQSAPTTSTTGGTGLAAATTYYYTIVAVNANGQSVASNEQSVLTGAGATNSNGLSWAAVPGATSYFVFRGTTSGNQTTRYSAGASTTFTDTGAAGTATTPAAVWPLPIGMSGGGIIASGAKGACDLFPMVAA